MIGVAVAAVAAVVGAAVAAVVEVVAVAAVEPEAAVAVVEAEAATAVVGLVENASDRARQLEEEEFGAPLVY